MVVCGSLWCGLWFSVVVCGSLWWSVVFSASLNKLSTLKINSGLFQVFNLVKSIM